VIGNVSVVIGANYGDCGKGLMTDYLAERATNPLVVRYNGGAQAGHTVVAPDGRRHVFHHFGSGSFVGGETHLSAYFLVSPIFFCSELLELRAVGVIPKVSIDHKCQVTTPYDIMINQAVENHRAGKRHGSCGMGVNETIERSVNGWGMMVHQATDAKFLRTFLKDIRNVYVPERLRQLGLERIEIKHLDNKAIIDRFIQDTQLMLENSELCLWETKSWTHNGDVIFEGAQGLQLDMDNWQYPHVTRSKTGLPNVIKLLSRSGAEILGLDVYYMTRTYMTRHGAGPMNQEYPAGVSPYPAVSDNTNVWGTWQGDLRYGPLNMDLLREELPKDLRHSWRLWPEGSDRVKAHLVVTHCDQIWKDKVQYVADNDQVRKLPLDQFCTMAASVLPIQSVMTSHGKTRATITTSPKGTSQP